jgi:hypothetical protein
LFFKELKNEMISNNNRSIAFCIELISRNLVKRITLPDGSGDRLTIEGYIGELTDVELVENMMLEVKGTKGVLRMDVTKEELEKVFRRIKRR